MIPIRCLPCVLWLTLTAGRLAAFEAAAPVASVLSTGPVFIRGTEVYLQGVISWPILSGDEVKTGSNALLLFRDQSRVFLAKNCRVKLEQNGNEIRVRLLQGNIAFTFAPNASIAVQVLDEVLSPVQGKQGTVSLQGARHNIVFGANPPDFSWEADALMQRLSWVVGGYLPLQDAQRDIHGHP